ncbi:flavin reductase family protein [Salicibibacter cibarius]|uniref:Flavin reductase family protein n=1 Tax=Salicibibacter cibarius TaxID=2743000 RepID=A0A7T6Z0E3_9BACI|nr:flavin reductase family protein [Salicibibacter cibarius]QQK74391.1 flavin reductase family protein [Salicibibacter cibarius]
MDFQAFRNTLGHFSTGVTVVSTKSEYEFLGFTANAFSSVSMDPPIILVCIDKKATSLHAFKPNHPFVINILTKEQKEDGLWFSKKSDEKFKDISYTVSKDGVPVLDGNLATIECDVAAIIEAGDHYIITGNVKDVVYDDQKDPLIFFRGQLQHLPETQVNN